MNVRKVVLIAGLAVAAALMAGKVRAGESDQAVRVTFSGPVQIPGQVLPAGTYWFMLIDDTNRNLVQILSADRSKSYGVMNTVPLERPRANSNTAFTLAKPDTGGPEAVVAWFYSGYSTGHEFVYPKDLGKEIAKSKQNTQVSGN